MPNRCRPRLAATLGVVLLLAAPLAGAADEAQLDAIARETAELRELPALAEIDVVFIGPDELRARLPDLIAEDYPPEEAAADGRAYVALGLLPEGTDLLALYLDLLGEQVAGYYDPLTDEMVVLGEDADLDAVEEFTYSHEIVHALQDAHLGLDAITESLTERNGDEATAIVSLVEGDATVASLDYLTANPQLATGIAFGGAPATPVLDAAPGTLIVWLIFPYAAGPEFVAALRAEGGWEAVDAAYADLPESTEQILHPEKYLGERDDPIPVSLPELAPVLGEGWELVDEDTLGELTVALLLADLGPGEGIDRFTGALALPAAARNAAAGWGGDRYALWADDETEALVWDSTWDTEEDARAFSRALALRSQERFGGSLADADPDAVTLETPETTARIVRTGADVRYLQAPSPELVETLTEALR
ncbi:MAG: hypothetical protein H0U10_11935 [Chloroflexia bacterium]|nr:hypothetical protein [Chloroflexia bacterium]